MQRFICLLFCFAWLHLAFSQRIGINNDGSAPASSATLDVKSTTKGFLLPRLTTTQRSLILSPADGLLVYDSSQNHLYNFSAGSGWRKLIHSHYWSGFDNTIYKSAGNIGIGISNPLEKLHLSGGNFKLLNGDLTLNRQSGLLQRISFAYTGGSPNNFTQGIDYLFGGNRSGYINFTASTSTGLDALRLSPSGVGQNALTMLGNGEYRWNALGDITLQMQAVGVNKGFVQISGDDLRLGTNAGNSDGRVVIRTNGADRVFLTDNGRMGIGEALPSEALHVNGSTSVSGTLDVNARTSAVNLEFSGKLTKPFYGTASLTPLCYGSVNLDGSVRSVTPNVTVSRSSIGTYAITCTGIDDNCVILVTAAAERHLANGFSLENNVALVRVTYDSSTGSPPNRDSDFCFVIYKK